MSALTADEILADCVLRLHGGEHRESAKRLQVVRTDLHFLLDGLARITGNARDLRGDV